MGGGFVGGGFVGGGFVGGTSVGGTGVGGAIVGGTGVGGTGGTDVGGGLVRSCIYVGGCAVGSGFVGIEIIAESTSTSPFSMPATSSASVSELALLLMSSPDTTPLASLLLTMTVCSSSCSTGSIGALLLMETLLFDLDRLLLLRPFVPPPAMLLSETTAVPELC